jgi:hypothetical protein
LGIFYQTRKSKAKNTIKASSITFIHRFHHLAPQPAFQETPQA